MKEPLILHLNSAGRLGQLALSEGNILLAEQQDEQPHLQSSLLNAHIRALLKEAKRDLSEIDAVSVVSGPGSFTGLRIGVSTAKGLCYGLNIPLIGVSALDIQLEELRKKQETSAGFVAAIPSGKTGWYMKAVNAQQEVVLEAGYYPNGEAEAFRLDHPDFTFRIDLNHDLSDIAALTDMKSMILIGVNKYYGSIFENLAYFEPLYINPFQSGDGKKA